jgi:hypothetical protein
VGSFQPNVIFFNQLTFAINPPTFALVATVSAKVFSEVLFGGLNNKLAIFWRCGN